MNKPDTTNTGRRAEILIAEYLASDGYQVIDRNWRNKWCEIDIIAKKNNDIYFVEVRYRKSSTWGSGLETITSKKFQQMNFAAELWLSSSNKDCNAYLAVASVSGDPFVIDDFIVL